MTTKPSLYNKLLDMRLSMRLTSHWERCAVIDEAINELQAAGNWRVFAKEGETAVDVIERERADNIVLLQLLAKERTEVATLRRQNEALREGLALTDAQVDHMLGGRGGPPL